MSAFGSHDALRSKAAIQSFLRWGTERPREPKVDGPSDKEEVSWRWHVYTKSTTDPEQGGWSKPAHSARPRPYHQAVLIPLMLLQTKGIVAWLLSAKSADLAVASCWISPRGSIQTC